jgi:hypothetical protein
MAKPRVIKARRQAKDVPDEYKEVQKKVERYATLQTLLTEKAEEFARATSGYQTELKNIEKEILKFAEEHKVTTVDGIKFEAEVRGKTTNEIPPKKLHDMLVKQKKKAIFFDLVKVRLTDAKKVLGEVMIKPIMVSTLNKYNKIVVQRKP